MAKIGRTAEVRIEFHAVPVGTRGRVLRLDPRRIGYALVIEWDLPDRIVPLVDWFTMSDYEHFLREIDDAQA